MLRAMNRHNWRPGHTHVVVEARDKTVITHVFDASSDYLEVRCRVRRARLPDSRYERRAVTFDFVLEPADA